MSAISGWGGCARPAGSPGLRRTARRRTRRDRMRALDTAASNLEQSLAQAANAAEQVVGVGADRIVERRGRARRGHAGVGAEADIGVARRDRRRDEAERELGARRVPDRGQRVGGVRARHRGDGSDERGDGEDRRGGGAHRGDHPRHQRARVPDEPPRVERRRRGGARRRRRARLRGRRRGGAHARPAEQGRGAAHGGAHRRVGGRSPSAARRSPRKWPGRSTRSSVRSAR